MRWDVVEVVAAPDLSLYVRFADGTSGLVRFAPEHLIGVFEPLKDPNFFSRVFIDHGAVVWPGEIDLAPDAMYAEIKKNGEWILT
jgi:hypothetical protein